MKPTPSHFTVQKARAISQYLDLNLEMPNRMIIRKELEAIISASDPYADISAAVLTTYDPEIVSFLIQEQGESSLTCIRNAKGKPLPWHELDPLKWTTSGFFELAKVAGHIEADAFNRAQWRAFRQFIQRAKREIQKSDQTCADIETEIKTLFTRAEEWNLTPHSATETLFFNHFERLDINTQQYDIEPGLAALAVRAMKITDAFPADWEDLINQSLEKGSLQILMGAIALGHSVQSYDLKKGCACLSYGDRLKEKVHSAHGIMELKSAFPDPIQALSTPTDNILSMIFSPEIHTLIRSKKKRKAD